jgi:ribonuclease HI
VIVRVRDEPEMVWAGSMSNARSTTTNNLAEYQGLCTGLDAAARQGWAPIEVVGDSMMIIRQMRTRTRPKAQTLRPLYEKARSLADALRIRRWHHHTTKWSIRRRIKRWTAGPAIRRAPKTADLSWRSYANGSPAMLPNG